MCASHFIRRAKVIFIVDKTVKKTEARFMAEDADSTDFNDYVRVLCCTCMCCTCMYMHVLYMHVLYMHVHACAVHACAVPGADLGFETGGFRLREHAKRVDFFI